MAQGVQNGKPRMSRSRGGLYLATVLLLLLLPCLGLWGSRAYLRAQEAGDLARWRRLEPLPAGSPRARRTAKSACGCSSTPSLHSPR